MRSRLLVAALVLDALCVIATPFVAGFIPTSEEAAVGTNNFLVLSDGHCYELSQLEPSRWRIEGEADITLCDTFSGE